MASWCWIRAPEAVATSLVQRRDQRSSSPATATPGCGGDGTCTATGQYQRALLAQSDGKDSRDPRETHRGEVGAEEHQRMLVVVNGVGDEELNVGKAP